MRACAHVFYNTPRRLRLGHPVHRLGSWTPSKVAIRLKVAVENNPASVVKIHPLLPRYVGEGAYKNQARIHSWQMRF